MSIRLLVLALVLHASLGAAAESIHLSPPGTRVSGSFNLAGKTIPLPEGEFALAATTVTEARIVEGNIAQQRPRVVGVFLAQVEGQRLRSAVWTRTVLNYGATTAFNWVQDPCRKEDVLFRLNLADDASHGDYAHHNCLLVNHLVRNLGPNASGILKDAAAWLAQQNVQLPVPVLIAATVTRTERRDFIQATYAFNPRMYGCNAPLTRSWAESPWHRKFVEQDAQRVRFVDSVTAWGKLVQHHFNELIASREPPIEKAVSIYGCASAQALSSRQAP